MHSSRKGRFKLVWVGAVLVLLIFLGSYFLDAKSITHLPGITVQDEPHQVWVTDGEQIRHRGNYLTPVARFTADGRVLGIKRYRNEPSARLAPYDLAIGWGPMSDSEVLDQLSIVQTNRVYTWSYDEPPIPPQKIIRHSANIHVIPADIGVQRILSRIQPDQLVRMDGLLVNVLSSDGSRWNTSTSRTDAGIGACEILWVESIEVLAP